MIRAYRPVVVVIAVLLVASGITLGGATIGQSATTATEHADMSAVSGDVTTSPSSNSTNGTDDWPAPRGDSGQTGVTSDDGPLPYGNVSWQDRGQSGGRLSPTTAAVVVDGIVYMPSGDDEAPDGTIRAYNASTGQVEWEQTDLGERRGSAVVEEGNLFVSTVTDFSGEFAGYENRTGLYALNASTGEVDWRINSTFAPPLAANGYVFTNERPFDRRVRDEQGNRNVTAINSTTGERAWTSDVNGQVVAHADGRLFVTDERTDVLYALDSETGSVEWQTTVPEDVYLSGELAAADDTIVLTNYGPPRGITDERQLSEPAKTLYAYNTSDGSALWTKSVTARAGNTTPDRLSGPAIDDGTVYVTSDADRHSFFGGQDVGTVHALDAETGETRWRFETTTELTSAPSVANGTVYVAGTETDDPPYVAFALDASDGSEKWNLNLNQGFGRSTPTRIAVADDQLFITARFEVGLPPTWRLLAVNATEERPSGTYQVVDDEPVVRNAEPLARIEASPPPGYDRYYEPNTTVTLNASSSVDPDGEISSFEWDLDGDGKFETSGETVTVSTDNRTCTTTIVELRVTDDQGDTDTRRVSLRTHPGDS